jgi:hypothetical protein
MISSLIRVIRFDILAQDWYRKKRPVRANKMAKIDGKMPQQGR